MSPPGWFPVNGLLILARPRVNASDPATLTLRCTGSWTQILSHPTVSVVEGIMAGWAVVPSAWRDEAPTIAPERPSPSLDRIPVSPSPIVPGAIGSDSTMNRSPDPATMVSYFAAPAVVVSAIHPFCVQLTDGEFKGEQRYPLRNHSSVIPVGTTGTFRSTIGGPIGNHSEFIRDPIAVRVAKFRVSELEPRMQQAICVDNDGREHVTYVELDMTEHMRVGDIGVFLPTQCKFLRDEPCEIIKIHPDGHEGSVKITDGRRKGWTQIVSLGRSVNVKVGDTGVARSQGVHEKAYFLKTPDFPSNGSAEPNVTGMDQAEAKTAKPASRPARVIGTIPLLVEFIDPDHEDDPCRETAVVLEGTRYYSKPGWTGRVVEGRFYPDPESIRIPGSPASEAQQKD